MRRLNPLFFALLSALLLWASWPTSTLAFLVFAGFVPLLWLAEKIKNIGSFFLLTYLSLLIWNVLTTWWICEADVVGGILAMVLNPLLMSIPWLGYFRMKKKWGQPWGFVSLVAFWLTFEYIHLQWEFSWPWLTLGNVFAMHPDWVRWYAWTGTSGGSLWILLVNISLFLTIQNQLQLSGSFFPQAWKAIRMTLLLLTLPLLVSWMIIHLEAPIASISGGNKNIVVVQPNFDPYSEKFNPSDVSSQLTTLLTLSRSRMDSNTQYLVWPETTLFPDQPALENTINQDPTVQRIRSFLKTYPHAQLISGASTAKIYGPGDPIPSSARQDSPGGPFYDIFNAAVQIDQTPRVQFYHKSKLVPGVEIIPYDRYFKFLEKLAIHMGGANGSYGTQKHRSVFVSPFSSTRVAPIICYESIYGEYVTGYVRRGAGILCIMTNDGWWGNTQGHLQHLHYAVLRAIEDHRWVVRCANTGISCFITPSGKILDQLPYWKRGTIKMNIPTLSGETFYVRHGDLISKAALLITLFLLIWNGLGPYLIKSYSRA
ncbi:MAG: apolipoprotein N-acyltransferase [Chitinophagaceae bacterium]